MLLCSIKMQNIQIFYEDPVMFVVTCSVLINIAEEENISLNVTLRKTNETRNRRNKRNKQEVKEEEIKQIDLMIQKHKKIVQI